MADLDNLLADYLDGDGRPSRRERKHEPARGEPPPDPKGEGAQPEAKAAAEAKAASEAKAPEDLDELLASYLEVESGSEESFAMPRSPEVDDLLRRYVLEEQNVSQDLATTLREHVREVRETSEERSVTATPPPRDGSAEWSQAVAARLRETADIDERVRSYAAAVAQEVERSHAFSDDHDSTIKGVPPGNAPPIPLGSELARKLKGQQKKR